MFHMLYGDEGLKASNYDTRPTSLASVAYALSSFYSHYTGQLVFTSDQ